MDRFISEGFRQNEIVPDVLDLPPTQLAYVQYKTGKAAVLGNELTPSDVINEPSISWPFDDGQLYTLIFLDADSPSRGNATNRSFLHWLVYNVQGNDLHSGQTYASYFGSTPGPDSGLHRYIFLVFPQQRGNVTLPAKTLPAMSPERKSFNVQTFSSLHGLGRPVAGNFFQAQPDSYSDSFWAKAKAAQGKPT